MVLRNEPVASEGELMRFRLFYQGPIYSGKVDIRQGEKDKKANHKHALRRCFHSQLKDLWQERAFLRETDTNGEIFGIPSNGPKPLADKLAELSPEVSGYRFIPLVHEAFDLTCSISILLQRRDRPRDRPGYIFNSRDIDNRLKIIFDALKIPEDTVALGDERPLADGSDNPMYVLLQKDEFINHVSVETDDLLSPPKGDNIDDAWARILLDIKIGLWNTNIFNIMFGGD